jgi:hypothetical protein
LIKESSKEEKEEVEVKDNFDNIYFLIKDIILQKKNRS